MMFPGFMDVLEMCFWICFAIIDYKVSKDYANYNSQ